MEFDATFDSLPMMMNHILTAVDLKEHERQLNKIQLACEEALVNSISYAYPHKKGKIAITCEKKGRKFVVTLRDHGIPFNPIDAEINPQVNIPLHDRKIGGLGLFLLRRIIDEASYQRINEENILRLAFNLD